jgi:hypothetical protein
MVDPVPGDASRSEVTLYAGGVLPFHGRGDSWRPFAPGARSFRIAGRVSLSGANTRRLCSEVGEVWRTPVSPEALAAADVRIVARHA